MKSLQKSPFSQHGKRVMYRERPSASTMTSPLAPDRESSGLGWRQRLVLALIILLATLLGTLFFGPVKQSFAQTTSFITCRTALPQDKPNQCNGTDPYVGQCTFDAATGKHPDFEAKKDIKFNGQIVGRVELRFFEPCHTYWGRVFGFIAGSIMLVSIPALGSDSAYSSTISPVFSDMVYLPPGFCCLPAVNAMIKLPGGQTVTETIAGSNTLPQKILGKEGM